MKKGIAVLLTAVMLSLVPSAALAETQPGVDTYLPTNTELGSGIIDSITTQQSDLKTPDLVVTEDSLDLTEAQIQEYQETSENLAEALATADSSEVSEIIRDMTADTEVTIMISDMADQYYDENGEIPVVKVEGEILNETYVIDENRSIEITPTYVIIDELNILEDAPIADASNGGLVSDIMSSIKDLFVIEAHAATYSKAARYDAHVYAVLYGYELFTMSVVMDFYYNNTKAWYKGNFDAYWKKTVGGLLIMCGGWDKGHEAYGTSYQGFCSGVFGEGVVIGGNLIAPFSNYFKATLKCNKDGGISRTLIKD